MQAGKKPPSVPPTRIGQEAETIAARHLERHGVKLIERNFHCRFGEIDIIGLDKKLLIFVEVRYRRNEKTLAVVETIGQRKCRKLILTSEYYLNRHPHYRLHQCRYDVIIITNRLEQPLLKWIKDAFQT